jgi:hypothetical protein
MVQLGLDVAGEPTVIRRPLRSLPELCLNYVIPVPHIRLIPGRPRRSAHVGRLAATVRTVSKNFDGGSKDLQDQRLRQMLELARPKPQQVVVHCSSLPK